jgi:hypothetical protein
MGSVVEFKQREEPHQSGEAVCISCRHKWVAVAPVGTWLLECPQCTAVKGVFRWPTGADEGDSLFVCKCGCEALTAYIHQGKFRLRCMSCAIDHTDAVFG